MARISVKTASGRYPVIVGERASEQIAELVAGCLPKGRLFVFYDAQFYGLHGRQLSRHLGVPASRVAELVLPPGERTKSTAHLKRLHDYMLSSGISRSDLVLACGGGVTTDLVGYAAATVLRGVRWAAVPTTLIGQVDAAIGGKTGINHRLGKNLIGAFWQPEFVCADTVYLATLPRRELTGGLGELIKYAGLIGGDTVADLTAYLAGETHYQPGRLSRLVRRCVRYKASIVAEDERDRGVRMYLNLGHTFAHAIETVLGYGRLRHGEAVILGLAMALDLSCRYEPRARARLEDYDSLVGRALRLIPYRKIDVADVLAALAYDKKREAGDQRFVLLAAPGEPLLRKDVKRTWIRSAIGSALKRYAR